MKFLFYGKISSIVILFNPDGLKRDFVFVCTNRLTLPSRRTFAFIVIFLAALIRFLNSEKIMMNT